MSPANPYLINYIRVFDLLEEARRKLKRIIQDDLKDENERAAAAAAFLDVAEEIAQLERAHESFTARYKLKAPSAAIVQTSRELAERLGREIARRNTAEAILELVTEIVGAWDDLSSGGQAAAAGALEMAFARPAEARRQNSEWLRALSN